MYLGPQMHAIEPKLLILVGVSITFSLAGLEPRILLILVPGVPVIKGACHHTWPIKAIFSLPA
jgi:hypothetical protein